MADTNNSPAFPCDETHGDGEMITKRHLGMSQRLFGAFILAGGILADHTTSGLTYDQVSDRALAQADSLITKAAQS